MINNIKEKLKKNALATKIYLAIANRELHKEGRLLTYKLEDLNINYYNKIKDIGDAELEHQIGRLTNIKDIIENCAGLEGDIAEFGTWRGFSLLYIAYFLERNAIFDKKLYGIDGFIGLPYNDGIFTKFGFSDTSYKTALNNVKNNSILYKATRDNIHIAKYLYNQKAEILSYFKRNKTKKLCFVHIDCDVSQSAIEIFEILTQGGLLADKAYIQFDDYYLDTHMQKTVESFIKKSNKKWEITKNSETNLTASFLFERKKKENG